MGVASHESPGQGAQGFTEGRWGNMADRAAVVARDGMMAAREGAQVPDIAEEKLELSGAQHGEHKDGDAGWTRCGTADTNNEERVPSEVELLGELSQNREVEEEGCSPADL